MTRARPRHPDFKGSTSNTTPSFAVGPSQSRQGRRNWNRGCKFARRFCGCSRPEVVAILKSTAVHFWVEGFKSVRSLLGWGENGNKPCTPKGAGFLLSCLYRPKQASKQNISFHLHVCNEDKDQSQFRHRFEVHASLKEGLHQRRRFFSHLKDTKICDILRLKGNQGEIVMTFERTRLIRSDCLCLHRFLSSFPTLLDFFCLYLKTHNTNHPFKLAPTLIKKRRKVLYNSNAVTAVPMPGVCSYYVSSYNSLALSTQRRDLNRFKRAFRNLNSLFTI